MRVSRAELGAAAALLLLSASPSFAQRGAPVPLFGAPPARQAPPAAEAPAPATATSAASSNDISATPLAPMDSSWVGTLGAADGALPRNMWSTTPKSIVAAALPLLQPTTSPVLQELARRLLLSDAVAPVGQTLPGQKGLIALRIDRLLALGQVDGVALLKVLPRAELTEARERDSLQLRFAANDVQGACRLARDGAARYRDAWWDRAVIACQALAGKYDEASLGLSAMRERKTLDDPVFADLIETIDGQPRRIDTSPHPTPMRMALLAAAKVPLPADALATAGPAALAVWATSDKVPAQQRLEAAEKAEAFGALPPAGLGLLYGSIQASAAERRVALKPGELPQDARERAILYDIARENDDVATRVAALTSLLIDARKRGTFVTMAWLVAPLVAQIPPARSLQGFAGEAARVLLVAGHPDQAQPWVDLANTPVLRVLAHFASPPDGGAAAPPIKTASVSLMRRNPTAGPRRVDLLTALLWAFGEKLDGIDFAPLLQVVHPGAVPGEALWLEQQQAASGGRLGETVLTSLLIATSGDHLTQEPILIARVVAGLRSVGLEADARALAVEAALDAGI